MNRHAASSTEQLLDIVRTNTQQTNYTGNIVTTTTTNIHKLAYKHAKLIVDIRSLALCILAIEQKVAHPNSEYFIIPISPAIRNDEEQLADFLRKKITLCTAKCKSVEIWSQLHLDNLYQTILEVSALKGQQLDKAVYWSLKKNLREADEKTHFIDYRVRPSLDKSKATVQVEVIAVPNIEIKRQKSLFENAGFSLTGVISKQCAVNAIINNLPEICESVLTLYVDREFSCISLFTNNNLEFSRTIRTGTSSFVEALQGTNFENDGEKEFTSLSISPYPNDSQIIFQHVQPVALRLARQIERTISLVSNKAIPTPEKIYLAGDYSWNVDFKEFIERETGVDTKRLPAQLPPELSLKYFDPKVRSDSAFTLLYATIFVEQNDGINLLHDFSFRRKLSTRRNIYLASSCVAIMALLMLFLTCCWQYASNSKLQNSIASLYEQVDAKQPRLTQKALLEEMKELESKRKQVINLGKNLAAPALLSMLNSMQNKNIRLLKIHYISGSTPLKYSTMNHRVSTGSVILDGIVTGEPHEFNTALAMYISQLGQSTFFSVPTVTLREQRKIPQLGTVLHFMLQCNLSVKGK